MPMRAESWCLNSWTSVSSLSALAFWSITSCFRQCSEDKLGVGLELFECRGSGSLSEEALSEDVSSSESVLSGEGVLKETFFSLYALG